MDTIITDPVSVSKVERIRAPQIYMTNPWWPDENTFHPNAEISFNSEKLLLLDGVVTAALPAPPVIRNVMQVIGDYVTFTSPITGQPMTIFVADFAVALASFYCKWYAADRVPAKSDESSSTTP